MLGLPHQGLQCSAPAAEAVARRASSGAPFAVHFKQHHTLAQCSGTCMAWSRSTQPAVLQLTGAMRARYHAVRHASWAARCCMSRVGQPCLPIPTGVHVGMGVHAAVRRRRRCRRSTRHHGALWCGALCTGVPVAVRQGGSDPRGAGLISGAFRATCMLSLNRMIEQCVGGPRPVPGFLLWRGPACVHTNTQLWWARDAVGPVHRHSGD